MGNVISLDTLINRICDGVQNFAWELAVKHAAYVYHLQDNLQSLETILQDLEVLRIDLNRRIRNKQGYGMQTAGKVDLWITRVEKQIATGDQLKTEGDRQVDSLCLAGICSTHYFSTSVVGGKVEKCVKELNTLKTEGEGFTNEDLVVNEAAELDLGDKMFCDSVGLEAKLDEVLTFLNQENVGIVGVYGQGGVGKTTLLKKINNHYVSRRSENFLVAWINVPKDVNVEAIQQAIGENIGLPNELKGSIIEVKASYISKALQQKRIILLLDDIREAINLSEIGIPPSDSLNNSKVVFTTRAEETCRKMEPQPGRRAKVTTLEGQLAWELFVKRVGEDIIDSHPQILQLARRVAEKCGGLPLALSIIGKAMSCEREPKVWEHTLQSFERPSLQRSKFHQEVDEDSLAELFSILRYSYDNLSNETYKSCFLHCALFPEACQIPKTIIILCWTFGDFSIDCDEDDELHPYHEAYGILSGLVRSCLLEDEEDYVRVHDVVRSMALWIAQKDTLVMSGLDEAPSVRMWSQMKRVSLMGNEIKELMQVPECPHLLSLFLNENRQLKEICSGFFESMGMLTVLDLSDTGIKELPESISRLVSLKYLNLSGTRITKLPVALIKLKALMYFNVGDVFNLGISRKSQIFSHLSSLQFLGMASAYYYYEEEGGGKSNVGEADEILLEELQVLENLKVLEITLTSFSGLMKLFNNRRLLEITRLLSLQGFTGPESFDISLLAHRKHLDSVRIVLCNFKELMTNQESTVAILKSGTSSVLRQMICFDRITRFFVGYCNYLEDITCVVSMPALRNLRVIKCPKLKAIVSREKICERALGGEVNPIFSSLVFLLLEDLPVLKSIYPSNTLSLRFLGDLTVDGCPELKVLPLHPYNGVLLGCRHINLIAEQEWWDAVEWKDDFVTHLMSKRFNLNYLR